MANYSGSEKALHRFYLSNYFLAKASFELDLMFNGKRADKSMVHQFVFVSGLARAGTTALMRGLFETGAYASLQYSNMPILLAPNLWNKKLNLQTQERAHGDGIIVDGNSPEEFDEYFWKAFLKDSYIQNDGLQIHEIPETILRKYQSYVSLICYSKKKVRYLSKNNNNILRLNGLKKLPNSHIIMMFRHPVSHASSLMNLHKRFSVEQKDDAFMLEYFNFLGHHEFGIAHKPFLLTNDFIQNRKSFDPGSLDYWIYCWINYYEFLLNQDLKCIHLIAFEDLIEKPESVFSRLKTQLRIESAINISQKHKPKNYTIDQVNNNLLSRAMKVYNQLYNISAI